MTPKASVMCLLKQGRPTTIDNTMKNTIITLASIVAFAGASNGQTSVSFNNLLNSSGLSSGAYTYDGSKTVTFTPGSAIDHNFGNSITDELAGNSTETFTFVFSAPTDVSLDFGNIKTWTGNGTPGIVDSPYDGREVFNAFNVAPSSVTLAGTHQFTNGELSSNVATDAAPTPDYEYSTLKWTGITSLTFNAQLENTSPQDFSIRNLSLSPASVPEPSSTALLGLGALGFIARRKR